MNECGRRLHEHFRWHEPDGVAVICDPVSYFASVGICLKAEIEELVASMLGDPLPEESNAEFRARRSRALEDMQAHVLAEVAAAGLSALLSRIPTGDRSAVHFDDHLARLATYYSEGGLGL